VDNSSRQAQDEIEQWRDRCDGLEDEIRRLEDERASQSQSGNVGSIRGSRADLQHDGDVAELRNEIHSLVDELNSLSSRNDDLIAARERDAQALNDMEAQVAEYKRKHDAVRIELRNLKGEQHLDPSRG
jgi:chromosome segregation ATPase